MLLRSFSCREQYSAERMNLVVLGGEPLDTLQQVGGRVALGVLKETGAPSRWGRRCCCCHCSMTFVNRLGRMG